ncbi:hypothetical protein [Bounagaea algeriensis]
MTESIVRLVYERTAPFGVDAGVEPLIAVCATEEEAELIRAESTARDRYASWEKHPLQGAAGRTTPLADGEIVHVVLLGGGNEPDDPDRDPIGVAVYTDRQAAERRATEEWLHSGDPGYHATSLLIGWRADR